MLHDAITTLNQELDRRIASIEVVNGKLERLYKLLQTTNHERSLVMKYDKYQETTKRKDNVETYSCSSEIDAESLVPSSPIILDVLAKAQSIRNNSKRNLPPPSSSSAALSTTKPKGITTPIKPRELPSNSDPRKSSSSNRKSSPSLPSPTKSISSSPSQPQTTSPRTNERESIIARENSAEERFVKMRNKLLQVSTNDTVDFIPSIFKLGSQNQSTVTSSSSSSHRISPLYALIQSSLRKVKDTNIFDQIRISIANGNKGDIISILQSVLYYHFEEFQKAFHSQFYLKNLDSFGSDDINLLFRLWYRYQRMLHIVYQVESYAKNESKLTESDTHINQSKFDFQLIPVMTPFHFRRHVSMSIKCFRSVRSPEWKSDILRLVEKHHTDLQYMLEYYMEQAIANQFMREIVHSIKLCCEETLATGSGNSKEFKYGPKIVQIWIEALRKFRDVYNCLLYSGKELSCCIYIEK